MPKRNTLRGFNKISVASFIVGSMVLYLNAYPAQVPFKSYGHLIVARGSIDGLQDLNLVIDTGATYTMISKQLCKRLRMKTEKVTVVSWGKEIKVKAGQLQDVKIGTFTFNDVQTRVGDLRIAKDLRVDALIGLDLLKRTGVLIDYEAQVLTFGSGQDFCQRAAFYPSLPYVPIHLQVQGKLLTLVLDTGAPHTIFFEEEVSDRVDIVRTGDRVRIGHAGGNAKLRKVLINESGLAATNLETITAYLMNASSAPYGGAAGILSPVSLKLKRLHINFETRLISWEL